ncbi:MAG: hypothetical protein IPL65_18490 [Lewinellaceae bacterium]|nr:hypothetical protein [Lewinellaceae bacterium]
MVHFQTSLHTHIKLPKIENPLPHRQFSTEVNAPASRGLEHCREWVQLGAEVTVITCVPNFPQGKVYAGYRNKFYQEEEMEGIKVIRVWSYISANEGFIKRGFDYISYAVMAFWASLWEPADVIIATSPQFFTAIAGYFSGLFKRKPWIMEVPWLKWQVYPGLFRHPRHGAQIRFYHSSGEIFTTHGTCVADW